MRNSTQSVGECSSSTSLSSQQDVEDDRMIALVLSEEYAKLDGAVARRLSNLAPVPHIPRINSYIPNLSDASLDHQRLLQRLNVYGLYEVKVSGDGNCQFRALSDQMYKSPEYHKQVRKEIVKQLKDCRSMYEGYVPMKYKRYYKKMSKSGEWGDHLTLQAAADKFAAKICLLTSFRDTCFIEIMPQYQPPKRGKPEKVVTISHDKFIEFLESTTRALSLSLSLSPAYLLWIPIFPNLLDTSESPILPNKSCLPNVSAFIFAEAWGTQKSEMSLHVQGNLFFIPFQCTMWSGSNKLVAYFNLKVGHEN